MKVPNEIKKRLDDYKISLTKMHTIVSINVRDYRLLNRCENVQHFMENGYQLMFFKSMDELEFYVLGYNYIDLINKV